MLAKRKANDLPAMESPAKVLVAKKEPAPMILGDGTPTTIPKSIPPTKLTEFKGNLLLIGFGSIGKGVLPLLLKHINMKATQITIITGIDRQEAWLQVAGKFKGVKTIFEYLTPENYLSVLPDLKSGDFVVNLSVDVSTCAILEWCHARGVGYVDTVIEPWKGRYTDPSLSHADRSNYMMREEAIELKHKFGPTGPTAVLTHGANPGMVSHFVKQALMNIAGTKSAPETQQEWAALAASVGVKTIHIAERDSQVTKEPKKIGEFVNTWSIDGFISEGCQPAELGWGTHEKKLPSKGNYHTSGCKAAIYINQPGASTKVRTWTPKEGPFHGFLITHNEAISLADYFTIKEESEGDAEAKVVYRPTVHYAYHPCDDAVKSIHELAGKNWKEQAKKRLIIDEIVSGTDELGVLLMGTKKDGKHFTYWYGSQLDVRQTRRLVEYSSATTLQVTAGVLAATVWAMRNPNRGILEPEELPHHEILGVMHPYIAPVVGEFTDWTPLTDREILFPEDVDRSDPFQFRNVLV